MPDTVYVATGPKLSDSHARILVETARKVAGVAIAADKLSFLELRVGRRLRELGCPDFESYIALLQGPQGAAEAKCVAEALTTHTTSFFREKAHYDWLAREGLPALANRRTDTGQKAGPGQKLVVWSAACSLGSEMWSAAMLLDRFAAGRADGLSWEVVGTDVSRRILRRAATAVFTQEEIAGIPEDFRRRYLMRARGPKAVYRIVPELRAHARLAWANLIDLDPRLRLSADVVFLRNVLIYFTPPDQERAVNSVVAHMKPGGYLMTGHSESLPTPPRMLRQIAASIYQKV